MSQDEDRPRTRRRPRARRRRPARPSASTSLFVDANGAYSRKQALAEAQRFADLGVSWFEEPVSSDDLEGLHLIRDQGPPGMDIAAGEYGYDLFYFRRMLESGAVDVLQADVTRCGGISEFLRAECFARRARCHSRHIAARRCTCTRRVACRPCATSSISTIMIGSSTCSSTVLQRQRAVP